MAEPQQLQMMLAALQALAQQTATAVPTDEASDLSQRANALEKIFEQIGALQALLSQQQAPPPEVQLMQPGPLEQLAQLEAQQQAQALGLAPPPQQQAPGGIPPELAGLLG